uniref:site-specific DNA-methyltransferase (adenine-specific) n=1 Tax=uncultured marine thaumarchaeote KM3_98_C03 TaxID=1456352 RepID=A0A075I2X0_9ARCH|nr:Type I restriction-modification system methyltransferase subunit (hsdM) [uncultured marine thaumarchaeote KM3_98_C03]
MAQKLTFQTLKQHLDASADILRGDIDASEFRQPIMTLLFLRRLSDQFIENAEKLEKKHPKEIAWNDADYHDFFIPEKARWKKIQDASENIGEVINKVSEIIEHENPSLVGVFTNTDYNDKKRFPDDTLLEMIEHFGKYNLANSNLENEDIFGQAYEHLLERFADSAGKTAGEFFTPREVVQLLVELLEPEDGDKICDPTCGSGGMLIWSAKFVKEKGGNPKNLVLHGQERNYGNFGMCRMNIILHGIQGTRIEHENVLRHPLLLDKRGSLLKYDKVIANYPFSQNWNEKDYASKDSWNRFTFGIPSAKKRADFAFIQHMYSILNDKGKAAIISSQGTLFRGGSEYEIRKAFIEMDHIESIISLPANLFYATGIPACVIILNKNKPKKEKQNPFRICCKRV